MIFNSLVIFPIWEADNLRFSWAFLISYPMAEFSLISFWIFCLNVYDSWLLASILDLYWLSYAEIFDCWAAESLRFYWASWTYPPRARISLFFFSMTPLSLSSSWVSNPIFPSRSLILRPASVPTYWRRFWSASFSLQVIFNSLFSFPICEAESLRFYWALFTSSPSCLFSLKSFWIFCL